MQAKVSGAVESFPGLVEKINKLQNVELSDKQIATFTKKAAAIRFGEGVKVDLNELLVPERIADEGNNLWRVFNRIQENILEGNFMYSTLKGKTRSARKIKNFQQDMDLNKRMFFKALEYAAC